MRSHFLRSTLVPLGVIVVLAAACADSSSSGVTGDGPAPATMDASDPAIEPVTIEIEASRFAGPQRSVPVGTTVVFHNLDPFDHTVTSAEGSPVEFGSELMGQGDVFEITFDEPGEYPYFCVVHPTMRGVITVDG